MAYFLPAHSRTKLIIRIFIRQYTKRSFFKLSEMAARRPFTARPLLPLNCGWAVDRTIADLFAERMLLGAAHTGSRFAHKKWYPSSAGRCVGADAFSCSSQQGAQPAPAAAHQPCRLDTCRNLLPILVLGTGFRPRRRAPPRRPMNGRHR